MAVALAHFAVVAALAAPPASFDSRTELRWLTTFGHVTHTSFKAYGAALDLTEPLGGPQPPLPPARLHAALAHDLRQAAQCARWRFTPPPTTRLVTGLRLQREVCRDVRRAAALVARSPAAARRELWASVAVSNRADIWMNGGILRPLPVRRGGSTSHVDPRYSRAASIVAHKRVVVRCWLGADEKHVFGTEAAEYGHRGRSEAAFAPLGGRVAHLGSFACTVLDALTYAHLHGTGPRDQLVEAYGLLVLAHEPNHLRGIPDEAVAQCYALQLVPVVADSLGVPPRWAHRYVTLLWRHWRQVAMGAYYTPQCRNGGPLDLHPKRASWP